MITIFRVFFILFFILIQYESSTMLSASKYLYDKYKDDTSIPIICLVTPEQKREIVEENQKHIDNGYWNECSNNIFGYAVDRSIETKYSFEKVCACIMLAGFENNVHINQNSTIHRLAKSCVFGLNHDRENLSDVLNTVIQGLKREDISESRQMTLLMLQYLVNIDTYKKIRYYGRHIVNRYLQNCLMCWRINSLQNIFFTFLKHTYGFTSSMYRNECFVLNNRSKFNRRVDNTKYNVPIDTNVLLQSVIPSKCNDAVITASILDNGIILQPHIGNTLKNIIDIFTKSQRILKRIEIQSRFISLPYSTFNKTNCEKIVLFAPIRKIEKKAFLNCSVNQVDVKSDRIENIKGNIACKESNISSLRINDLTTKAKIYEQNDALKKIIVSSEKEIKWKDILEDPSLVDRIYIMKDGKEQGISQDYIDDEFIEW